MHDNKIKKNLYDFDFPITIINKPILNNRIYNNIEDEK